jgi:hypothetical protein
MHVTRKVTKHSAEQQEDTHPSRPQTPGFPLDPCPLGPPSTVGFGACHWTSLRTGVKWHLELQDCGKGPGNPYLSALMASLVENRPREEAGVVFATFGVVILLATHTQGA